MYNGNYNSNKIERQVRDFFFRGRIPFTMFLVVATLLSFLVTAVWQGGTVPLSHLIFSNSNWPQEFWTIFTWPLINGGLNSIFAALVAWWCCGSLERSWGTRDFATFFIVTTALTAATLWGGGLLLNRQIALAGMTDAVAPSLVAWCVINRRETIYFWGIIPIPAPLIGLITVVFLWYTHGIPFLGLFALSGCAAGYWYAMQGRHAYRGYATNRFSGLFEGRSSGKGAGSTKQPPLRMQNYDAERIAPRYGWNLAKWWRDRKERRRLEQIFRNSGYTDPDERKR